MEFTWYNTGLKGEEEEERVGREEERVGREEEKVGREEERVGREGKGREGKEVKKGKEG